MVCGAYYVGVVNHPVTTRSSDTHQYAVLCTALRSLPLTNGSYYVHRVISVGRHIEAITEVNNWHSKNELNVFGVTILGNTPHWIHIPLGEVRSSVYCNWSIKELEKLFNKHK